MTKVLSIALAFQVLLSSLSFHIGMHFCGERLQSFSLFDKAEPCEHALGPTEGHSCPFHQEKQNNKKGCCDDREVVIEGQTHLTTLGSPSVDLSPPFHILPISVFILLEHFHTVELTPVEFLNYKPPLIRIDIQTFLI